MRHSVLQENWQDRSSDSQILSEADFMSPILVFLISRKALKSFMVTVVFFFPVTSRNLMRQVETFYQKYVFDCMYSPLPKSHLYCPFPLHLWRNFSELSEVLSPRMQSSYCPKLNLTHNSHVVHLFSQQC